MMLRSDVIYLEDAEIPCYIYEWQKGDSLHLPKCKKKVSIKKGKHKKEYLLLYCGFDIETTNVNDGDRKLAFMYIWQFIIAGDERAYVYLGRTWDDFRALLKGIHDTYNVSRETRLIIWDANFGFEFQFIRKQIEWSDDEYAFFAKEKRKPLLATCYDGIEFRDCLAISGGSLAQLAKDYCKTRKLVGDLDYSVMRNQHTELTREEKDYCINDVKILAEFSFFAFRNWIIPNKKVPLTKTGILRNEVKAYFKKSCKDAETYERMIQMAYPPKDEYIMWFRYLFRGGFVHANFFHADEVLENVLMYDITSSYPSQMLLRYYPVTPFVDDDFSEENLATKCCIMVVEFWDVETTTYHSIESFHKVVDSLGAKLDNGRIYKAKYMKVYLTELDFENYRRYMKWSRMNVISFKTSRRGKLPHFLTEVLKSHYIKKSALKRQGKSHTSEYAICKSGVNSFFGMTVTRISLDKVSYKDDWMVDELAVDYDEEVRKQLLLPQWGIYVSAWGRHELLSCVWAIEQKCPNHVVYCDTDSIKCVYNAQIPLIIEEYNKTIAERLKAEKLQNDAFSDLGMFDLEYGKPVDRLKTLGAKRYIYEVDGKVEVTIAGLPKDVLPKMSDNPFEDFDIDGMSIPVDFSGKLTTAYNDDETEAWVDGELMKEKSSVALYAIPFSMFTEKEYAQLILTSIQERRKFIHDNKGVV